MKKTRRTFMKKVLAIFGVGVSGTVVAASSLKTKQFEATLPLEDSAISFKDCDRLRKTAFEAGVRAAWKMSDCKKQPIPGWKCYVESLHHPFRHFQTGKIKAINYKDKTIDLMILDENPITDSRSSLNKNHKA